MADFLPALSYLLEDEGGYVNATADKGGPTNKGITQATAARYGYTGDMHDIPDSLVAQIYLDGYWNPPGLGGIASQEVADALLSLNANGGLGSVAQNALTALGIENDQDGEWGPNTLAAVNSADPDAFLAALSQAWRDRYAAIVAANPSQAVFLNGWNDRADRVLELQTGVAGVVAKVQNNPGTVSIVLIALGSLALLFFGRRG